MSSSAFTLPKYFETERTSSAGVPVVCGPTGGALPWTPPTKSRSSPRPQSPPVDQGVDDHGQEQDHPEEGEVPRAVPAGVDHPFERHPDDAGAERRADPRAVST